MHRPPQKVLPQSNFGGGFPYNEDEESLLLPVITLAHRRNLGRGQKPASNTRQKDNPFIRQTKGAPARVGCPLSMVTKLQARDERQQRKEVCSGLSRGGSSALLRVGRNRFGAHTVSKNFVHTTSVKRGFKNTDMYFFVSLHWSNYQVLFEVGRINDVQQCADHCRQGFYTTTAKLKALV